MKKPPKNSASRQGSVYIAVTGVAMVLSLIGLTAMHLSRLELRTATNLQDQNYARIQSMSAVELALAHTIEFSDWRTRYTHDVEDTVTPNFNFEPLYFKFIDPVDGDLGNNSTDPVEIQGIGRYGNSTYVYSVDYAPSVTSAQQVAAVLQSYEAGTDASEDVNDSSFFGQHFIPNLPAGVTDYSITHIDVYLEGQGAPGATLTFNFNSSDANGKPGTLIESLAIPESTLPPTGSPDYHQFSLSSATGLIPGQGYCFTLEQTGGGNAAIFNYKGGSVSQPNSHMLRGGWGSWSTEPSQSPQFRVHGVYTTETASGEFTITPGSWQSTAAP